jgi:predicted phosphate transport protein (TIGR00153 family)
MAFSSPLSDLFVSSPIKPMQDHVKKVYECAKALEPFMEAVFEADWDKVETLRKAVSKLEHDADDMKREIRLSLPKGLFLAVDRRDLLDLLSRQDRIANKAKDIAGVITGRKLQFPTVMHDDVMTYLKRCIDACKQALRTVDELDELITSGFKGHELLMVEKMINTLDDIEDDTDHIQVTIRRQLLALENDYPPVDVMFMYKIIDWMGGLADNAQLVGDRLELMVTR